MSHNSFVYLDDGISGSRDHISAKAVSRDLRSKNADVRALTGSEKIQLRISYGACERRSRSSWTWLNKVWRPC